MQVGTRIMKNNSTIFNKPYGSYNILIVNTIIKMDNGLELVI